MHTRATQFRNNLCDHGSVFSLSKVFWKNGLEAVLHYSAVIRRRKRAGKNDADNAQTYTGRMSPTDSGCYKECPSGSWSRGSCNLPSPGKNFSVVLCILSAVSSVQGCIYRRRDTWFPSKSKATIINVSKTLTLRFEADVCHCLYFVVTCIKMQ